MTSPHDPYDTLMPHTQAWAEIVDRIGSDALAAAIAADHDRTAAALRDAGRLRGRAFDRMIVGWADTLATHLGIPADVADDDQVMLRFCRPGTGEPIPVEDVSPDQAWAGRFLAARAAMDHATVDALLGDTGHRCTWGRRVGSVLAAVAAAMRHQHPNPAIPAQASRS